MIIINRKNQAKNQKANEEIRLIVTIKEVQSEDTLIMIKQKNGKNRRSIKKKIKYPNISNLLTGENPGTIDLGHLVDDNITDIKISFMLFYTYLYNFICTYYFLIKIFIFLHLIFLFFK